MMRIVKSAIAVVSLAAMLTPVLLASGKGRQVNPASERPSATGAPDGQALIYVPPRDKPQAGSARVVAIAGRGGPDDPPTFAVLSPDHVGLTLREQPSLFWYLSKSVKSRFVMTLMKDGDSEPVLELTLDGSHSGIRRLDLSTRNIKLQPDVQYEISIALVTDPEHRDKDICASGIIKRVPPPQDLLSNLQKRPRAYERAVLLARNGVWYDALAILCDQIDADNADKSSRMGRAALLDQVNLADAATYDRALAGAVIRGSSFNNEARRAIERSLSAPVLTSKADKKYENRASRCRWLPPQH